MKVKKITGFLALMTLLCLCLSACRPVRSGGDTTTEPIRIPGGETQLTMPDLDMPDKHEEDYELPPGEEPDVTVIDK